MLRGAVQEGWHEGVETLLKSRCTQTLYMSMSYSQRLEFIALKIGEHLETPDEYLRDRILLSIMAETPYAGVAMQFLIQEPPSETLPQIVLKCVKSLTAEDISHLMEYEHEKLHKWLETLKIDF